MYQSCILDFDLLDIKDFLLPRRNLFLEATQGKVSESLFLFIALFEAVKHMNFHEPMTVNVGWPPTCSNKTIFENEIEIEVVALHIQKSVIHLLYFLQIKSGVLNIYIYIYRSEVNYFMLRKILIYKIH